MIGKEIGKKLIEEGHTLIVTTRNISRARAELPFPAELYDWAGHLDAFPIQALENVDAVIHLAGESIASGRWNAKRKQLILNSRIEGTKKIVAAITLKAQTGCTIKHFISASAIGIYGDSKSLDLKEESTSGTNFLATVCKGWERETIPLKVLGIRVVNPRIGIVLSRQGGALEKMLPLFANGIGGVIGTGKQWMSWIHIEDIARLFVFCLNNTQIGGAINAVAPQPATNKSFSQRLAEALHRKLFFPVPSIVLKIVLGEMSALVLGSQNVSSAKAESLGFKFTFPSLKSALENICLPLRKGENEIFAEQWVPQKSEEVFPFFCDEMNLEKLTPDFLNFKVMKKSTPAIQAGTLIDYRLSLHGITMKWQSKIDEWKPNISFVDTQMKGPYTKWHHTHEFIPYAGGTLLRDRVIYKMPLGILGSLITGHKIRSDVLKIFSHRREVISKLFFR